MTFRAERFHWGDDVEFDWHPKPKVKLWDESKHPRDPGGEGGGQFIEAGGGDGGGDTNSSEFKAWFGDSKVVDKNGDPLVMYHGTNKDFTEFKMPRDDVGIHFGSARVASDRLAYLDELREGNARILSAYLKIENPLRMSSTGGGGDLLNIKYELNELFPADSDRLGKVKTYEQARQFIQSKGFDGIVYRNPGETVTGGSDESDSYVVFDPTQIKAAAAGGGDNARVTLPVGLGVPDGSPLAKAGISVVKHADAEKVVRNIATSVGAKITSAQHSFGGWTDPSDNTYYPEPTLVAEFSGKQEVTRLTADAIAHVLGPQKEVWIVNDGEKLPSARDLRLDIMPTRAGITAEQLSNVARKVDPQLFSGFTQTTDVNGRVGITVLVKDGIAPWRSAPSSTVVSSFGKPFEVQINPTERDVRSMIKDAQDSGFEEVRVILDRDQNLYVWEASNAIHASIETSLNLDAEERDLWTLEKGKLKGVIFDGSHGRPVPKDVIAGVAAMPTSSAAISVRADQGLLRLVSALDTAGIDAEVLPTAVLIDKRVANGEQGYRAQIEREAGVEAVIALDGYRARLAAALKAGQAPPSFDIDLAKLAAEHQQVRRKAFDWSIPHGDVKEWLWIEPYGDVKVWDESQHPRGETTPESTPGSFAPGGGSGTSVSDDEDDGESATSRLTGAYIIGETPAHKANSRKVPEVAREMNERAGKILRSELGVNSVTVETHNDRTDDFLASVVAADLKNGLRNGHSSQTWYSDTMTEAMRIAETIHPEIKDDLGKRWAFIASLAITSQGEVVDASARLTELAYKQFNETGKFPTDLKVAKPSINDNFDKLNTLVDKMGVDEARKFMGKEFTVRELKKMGYRMSRMGMDDRVSGSAILGPKIGEGFYQNLNGNFKPLTMDIWFMRSWGRITNSGVTEAGSVPEATKERLQNALKDDGRPVPKTNEKLAEVASEIFKQHERDYITHRADYNSGKRKKSELVHASERFYLRYYNGMIEAPRGSADRNWMTSVFHRAIAKLAKDGIHLTPAAAQATWWTPEKALYEHLGARVREVETDYAKTLRRIAEAQKSLDYEQWLHA